LRIHGPVSESTALPEQTKLDIFKDAVDCYAGYLNSEELHELVAGSIAASMAISPQQMRYSLNEGLPSIVEGNEMIQVGRSTLHRIPSRRRQPKRAAFALTTSARRTLDRIAASAECSEPTLLVGETGVGKTTLVQHVANLVGQTLTVVNLSQQSEAGDLLGGLKPVTTRSLIIPVVEKFNSLFDDTFSNKRNERFQIAIAKAIAKQNWPRLMILWEQAVQLAATVLKGVDAPSADGVPRPSKKRKLEASTEVLRRRWADFSENFKQIRSFVDHGDRTHAFAFVEGRLVQAVREGQWVLLDEINLAPSDTLDHIVGLLQNGDEGRPSLLLAEKGDIETVVAHPNFRLFAAMNPATDAGKKDLPPGLRSRFTEIYVPSGDDNSEDLTKIIHTYLGSQLDSDNRAALDLAKSYLALKKLNEDHQLTDGAGETPHFSIRSLVRCLLYVSRHGASLGLRRAMYEGFSMSFFTVLSRVSEGLALPHLEKHLLSNIKNRKAFFKQQPKIPHEGEDFITFRHHLVKKGPGSPDLQPHYIRTPSVERNLLNLARAASMGRFPILLQGPTSAGKTSMVEYLAKLSGNKFVRINNHEHTDLQEYLGSYVSDTEGKLVYQEGVLVHALRFGHWIVLDELNLAPSDVLEALNRLLDDNRELLIPESQEIVRPHPNFMLFATQNPAGLYGGRKRLSRAFRNRFLEIHFDDIPEKELEVILRERTQIAPPFCAKIVAVYKSLSLLRQSSRLFEQRNSFATLRDLFRWASRPVDDWQSLAYHGYMLLAERVRDPTERAAVKQTLEKEIKVELDENVLYGMSKIPDSVRQPGSLVWTPAMRRVFVLVAEALKNREPVLLVGETGCGKTQICQVIAEAFQRPLAIYNAHTNTETGDLVGSQRPIRNRSDLATDISAKWRALMQLEADNSMLADLDVDQIIQEFTKLDKAVYDHYSVEQVRSSIGAYQALFAWSDGSLVRAMKKGEHFLLDEISLAEDSVLERLNSVLEPSRTILLAEKGSVDNLVIAHPDFQFLATMNPGGDYGKRELSAALRNRLTEIWVPPLSQEADVLPILQEKLEPAKRHLAVKMLNFATWFRAEFHGATFQNIALRDLLAWSEFVNRAGALPEALAFLHGAYMVFVDSIGANPAGMTSLGTTDQDQSRQKCLDRLQSMVDLDVVEQYRQTPGLSTTDDHLVVGSFTLPRAAGADRNTPEFVFDAPTTLRNTMKIVRALQMTRPVLLEGSPGVGKTAIVTALAQACGKSFTRINLSDQTDLMDLFGADVPSDKDEMGKFSWQDGPLLQAMQCGGWVLLDEMNLASQSVLEGLNACLDHRREVYVAELDKSFACHPDFTLFAAQNPHHQGGGRKGLPSSFVNRFTVVYADAFEHEDLMRICQVRYPDVDHEQQKALIDTVTRLGNAISRSSTFAQGGPWEFNLRDVNRWLRLCADEPAVPMAYHLQTVLVQRFRNPAQREMMLREAEAVLGSITPQTFYNDITRSGLEVGTAFLPRDGVLQNTVSPTSVLTVAQLPAANSVITAVERNWPVILAGPSGAGKTTLLRYLAAAAGVELIEFSMNGDVDAMDLVGGFEQYDSHRDVAAFQDQVKQVLQRRVAASIEINDNTETQKQLLRFWRYFEGDDLKIENIPMPLAELARLLPEVEPSLKKYSESLHPSGHNGFRFVWNDGVLVDAIEKGSWLVLDNANLCNPSVLDRLNSLLEPDGLLTISEQHNGGNGTRVIKPHPNFKIFMTMDPRYGELSRAMRNRSLEVFLPDDHEAQINAGPVQYPLSSAISRLRHLYRAASQPSSPQIIEAAVDNLTLEDMKLAAAPLCTLLDIQDIKALRVDPDIVKLARRLSGFEMIAEIDQQWPQLAVLNEPLILLRGYEDYAEIFIRSWYLARRMAEINTLIMDAWSRGGSVALKDRTLLERSACDRDTRQKKPGPFPAVADIVLVLLGHVTEFLQNGFYGPETQAKTVLVRVVACEPVLIFAQQVLDLYNYKTLDTARFHAYMQIGAQMASDLEQTFPDLAVALSGALQGLSVGDHVLTTGFGLQLMWPAFRPRTAATQSQLHVQLRLEVVIARFDQICRSLSQSRSSLSAVRSNLRRAYQSIIESEQPERSLQVLEEAVTDLEAQARKGYKLEGKFEDVMQFVHGVITLQSQGNLPDLDLLTMFMPEPDKPLLNIGEEEPVPTSLARLSSFEAQVLLRDGSIGEGLFQQLLAVQKQPLGMLSHAKEELQVLARVLTSHSNLFGNLIRPVAENLRLVLGGMMFSLRDLLTPQAQACLPEQGSPDLTGLAALSVEDTVITKAMRLDNLDRFRNVYGRLIRPVLIHLTKDSYKFGSLELNELKTCLINLSLAGLILMVPDKLFDPAMYPTIAHDLHECRIIALQNVIDGQKAFHRQLTGHDTALLIRVLERELVEVGTSSPPRAVLRPGKEEQFKLQEVLNRIVNVILQHGDAGAPQGIHRGSAGWIEQWSSAQGRSNMNIIIERLEKVDRTYDDFAKPILWFLKCLYQGLELEAVDEPGVRESNAVGGLVMATPLLSGDPTAVDHWTVHPTSPSDLKMHWLHHILLRTALAQNHCRLPVDEFLEILDSFYYEWKERLTHDQADAEAKSRYYTYRGDSAQLEEDDDSEMNEMFPRFDNDGDTEAHKNQWDARATAVKLSALHQKIYSEQDPHETMQAFILSAAEILAQHAEAGTSIPGISFIGLLPPILLQVDRKMAELNGSQEAHSFNIYADSDITQSQKLFDLVHQIKSRFYTIQEKWPEHAVPTEVLSFCTEVLHLSISDPVAKMLTKTEKLLEIVSQWQSVASREWSVHELVEKLSSQIISWRRLELLSWSRLLDEETRRHEHDAQAWYFIAYEAVIYNARTFEFDDGDPIDYRTTLVQTLEEFLRSATLGQYSSRLKLLDTLNKTLQGQGTHSQALQTITTSVQAVIEHYRRYEADVEGSLRKGRSELEKALNEQIKLASWKDTNIMALRESARRSHHKLFKIVRKYRGLLNQAVVLGPPEEAAGQIASPDVRVAELDWPQSSEEHIFAAVEQCRRRLQGWDQRPERLTKPLGAARSMQHLYLSKTTDFAVQDEIITFRQDLTESLKELRTQTPAMLTEENAPFVRHLQERKKRLLADTLKAVAHMGIRRNLPTSELEKQSSTASILALPTHVAIQQRSPVASAADSTFHGLLDVMSQVRAARTEHSDDLTDGEVNRCVGLLEGLLSVILGQRQAIPKQASDLAALCSQLALVQSVAASPSDELARATTSNHNIQMVEERLAWLSGILAVGCRILKFQAVHAGLDLKDLIATLQTYMDQINDLRKALDDLPDAPPGMAWRSSRVFLDKSVRVLSQMGSTLRDWQAREPRIEFLLSKILVWTEELPTVANRVQDMQPEITLEEFDRDLKDALDQIFVTLQRISAGQGDTPRSEEDAGWLTKSDKDVVEGIRMLQVGRLARRIDQHVMSKLQSLSSADFEAAKSLLIIAMPIFKQFYHICEHLHNRQTAIYLETCRLALQLAKSFTTLVSQGFCRPSDPAEGQEEQSGKLESGTGLGEGEGAEDISKDVQDDEDLSELAQSGQKEERDEEMEHAEDAVDMGNEDLEGEMGDMDEKASDDEDGEDRSEDEDEKEIDEEAGSVDDLDTDAVDEKMWDDMKNESEKQDKEMKNDKAKGKKSDDDAAADGDNAEGDDMDGEQEELDEEDEDGEGGERPEGEQMDAHVDEEKALDLPEELNLAGEDEMKDDEISDDGMDELSDIEDPTEQADGAEAEQVEDTEKQDRPWDDAADEDKAVADEADVDNGVAQDDELMEDQPEELEDGTDDHDTRQDDTARDAEENAGGESGAANELRDDLGAEQDVEGINQADPDPNPEQSRPGKAPSNEEEGKSGEGVVERGAGRAERPDGQESESLKKLADALSQWHQRREILPAAERDNQQDQQENVDMADADLEHVPDEDEGDAQALGAAGVDQAQNLDQSKAIQDDDARMDEDTAPPDVLEPEPQEDITERFSRLKAQSKSAESRDTGAFVPDRQPQLPRDVNQQNDTDVASDDLWPEIEHLELSNDQAEATHPPTSSAHAAQLWHECSTSTHQFSLALTEQLRLILSPTTATKLRGDYRTGKRLNIKRIIPYIASNYKRDKIWMRRSVPSKRNYQIMIAVDDSKSMSESGADVLAFETLALLTKSLAMLEVGEICVVGFGDAPKITVAHPFGLPFSPAESGPNAFQAFSFGQRGTDVKRLLEQSIQLFRESRRQRQAGSEEQWQLQLIVSDGHISDHDAVARLLRRAHDDERIVVVFVIVDAGQESILDLKEAVYERDPNATDGNGGDELKLRMKRYLDGFPFPYYLVVREVRDLPNVLATALKGWFESVVDAQ
jgi:midasin